MPLATERSFADLAAVLRWNVHLWAKETGQSADWPEEHRRDRRRTRHSGRVFSPGHPTGPRLVWLHPKACACELPT